MKLIIFDAYGTLISTGTGSVDAVKKILELQDKDINPQEFYKEWKNNIVLIWIMPMRTCL